MKIKIVYFIFLVPNRWEDFIDEQIGNLKKLELYDLADEIYISCCGEKSEYLLLENKIRTEYSKIRLINYVEGNVYEYPGFKTIYDVVDEESIILYFHSKGIISGQKRDEYNKIRKLLFYYTIKESSKYIMKFQEEPDLKIISLYPGLDNTTWYNFFWVRGSFIIENQVDITKNDNRYVWERWFSNFDRIKTFSPIFDYYKIKDRNEIYSKNNELYKLLNL